MTTWQEQCERMPLAELKQDVTRACGQLDRLQAEASSGRIESVIGFDMTVTACATAHLRLESAGDHAAALDVIRAFAFSGTEPAS